MGHRDYFLHLYSTCWGLLIDIKLNLTPGAKNLETILLATCPDRQILRRILKGLKISESLRRKRLSEYPFLMPDKKVNFRPNVMLDVDMNHKWFHWLIYQFSQPWNQRSLSYSSRDMPWSRCIYEEFWTCWKFQSPYEENRCSYKPTLLDHNRWKIVDGKKFGRPMDQNYANLEIKWKISILAGQDFYFRSFEIDVTLKFYEEFWIL